MRRANKNDRIEIQVLMDELNDYRKSIFWEDTKEFHQRINPYQPLQESDFDESIFFVTIDEKNWICGFIQGTVHERKNHELCVLGYIDELFVKPEYRWRWIAKNLLSTLEEELKKLWCDHITTHTDQENTLSQEFYFLSGMKPTTLELWKKL